MPTTQSDYSYDRNGNRLSLIADTNTFNSSIASTSNRLLAVDKNATPLKTYSYDASGNIISDGHTAFSYDGRGRLVKATGSFGQEFYRINGQGQRVAKSSGAEDDLAGDANQDGKLDATDLRLIVLMVQGKAKINLADDCNHDGTITVADAACTQAKIVDRRLHPDNHVGATTYFNGTPHRRIQSSR